MKQRLLAVFALLTLSFGGLMLQPAGVSAASAKDEICKGVNAASATGCTDQSDTLQRIVNVIINIFSLVIGVVAVIMIMVGGFKYITANGDSNSITSAKTTITYALVGLIITALAQTLVKFVLDKTL